MAACNILVSAFLKSVFQSKIKKRYEDKRQKLTTRRITEGKTSRPVRQQFFFNKTQSNKRVLQNRNAIRAVLNERRRPIELRIACYLILVTEHPSPEEIKEFARIG